MVNKKINIPSYLNVSQCPTKVFYGSINREKENITTPLLEFKSSRIYTIKRLVFVFKRRKKNKKKYSKTKRSTIYLF